MDRSLSEKAYETIKAEIITCALRPGQQIAQRQLADQYQVGMTPVREALQRLAQEGFVQPIPRFGYVVSPVTFSDVHEIYELRSIAESAAVRLAAVRGSQEQLESISEAAGFTYTYGRRESYREFLERNAAFHRAIAAAAGNQRLVDLISRLLDELTRVFHLGLDLRDSAGEMRDEHVTVARALCDRDPDRAEQIVRSQIERSQQRVLEALLYQASSVPRSLAQAVQIEPRRRSPG